jgi:hypothetical protein
MFGSNNFSAVDPLVSILSPLSASVYDNSNDQEIQSIAAAQYKTQPSGSSNFPVKRPMAGLFRLGINMAASLQWLGNHLALPIK